MGVVMDDWREKYAYPSRWKTEKITLVCTSLNPDEKLLNKMRDSAKGFDHIEIRIESQHNPLPIPRAYNILIDNVKTEWVCVFCDDDYFYPQGLSKMIQEIHLGIDADVAHFKFHISGYQPLQDIRALIKGSSYNLCEKKPITTQLLSKHNRLPAGSFFRKSAWEKVGGFQGEKHHDWDLWLRMSQAGLRFKYFDNLVYNMVRRKNSAWMRQHK